MDKITGIYRIESPSGKTYIGQAIDIYHRWSRYKIFDCKSQVRLYRSLKKYGAESHKFEILEVTDDLNTRERFWQDHYDCTGERGLNCDLVSTDRLPYKRSKETINKIVSTRMANGYKPSKETKTKISDSLKGHSVSEETRLKISKASKGKVVSEETKAKLKGRIPGNARKVINLDTGVIYSSVKEAAEVEGVSYKSLSRKMNGGQGRRNNTSLRFITINEDYL
jgi:group I intron endonuclease